MFTMFLSTPRADDTTVWQLIMQAVPAPEVQKSQHIIPTRHFQDRGFHLSIPRLWSRARHWGLQYGCDSEQTGRHCQEPHVEL